MNRGINLPSCEGYISPTPHPLLGTRALNILKQPLPSDENCASKYISNCFTTSSILRQQLDIGRNLHLLTSFISTKINHHCYCILAMKAKTLPWPALLFNVAMTGTAFMQMLTKSRSSSSCLYPLDNYKNNNLKIESL